MIHNLSETNSIANRFVAELRDVNIQKDRMRFRRNLERLGEVFAYEISKTLAYKTSEVETPLGIANAALPNQRVVLATILRAGIPFHQGFLNYFDDAENAFVSAYRRHHKDGTFEISLEYVSCPNLDGCILIISDPMLATGASMNLAIKELKTFGKPAHVHIVTGIASAQGVSYVRRSNPKADIWVGAMDEELTAKSFIVPGLGDAGDLSYGAKVQE
ncbi:MAG: uracil phosphoribosyltransferase [Bacteroidota bacterium]